MDTLYILLGNIFVIAPILMLIINNIYRMEKASVLEREMDTNKGKIQLVMTAYVVLILYYLIFSTFLSSVLYEVGTNNETLLVLAFILVVFVNVISLIYSWRKVCKLEKEYSQEQKKKFNNAAFISIISQAAFVFIACLTLRVAAEADSIYRIIVEMFETGSIGKDNGDSFYLISYAYIFFMAILSIVMITSLSRRIKKAVKVNIKLSNGDKYEKYTILSNSNDFIFVEKSEPYSTSSIAKSAIVSIDRISERNENIESNRNQSESLAKVMLRFGRWIKETLRRFITFIKNKITRS